MEFFPIDQKTISITQAIENKKGAIFPLILQRPPSVNNLYVNANKHRFVSQKGKKWFEDNLWLIKTQIKGSFNKVQKNLHAKRLEVILNIYYCGRLDIDNGLKATFDLLMKSELIMDDHHIYKMTVFKEKVPHKENQKMELTIQQYGKFPKGYHTF